MEFIKEFAMFLYQNNIIKFGEFTLASGKKSSYYIDLRLVPSYPVQFRKMIKALQNLIRNQVENDVELDRFDAIATVPTGGLVVATALATDILKPLIYTRDKPKKYGTAKTIEGKIYDKMQIVLIDDVATTGGSVVQAVKALREADIKVSEAYVIVDRLEGDATETLKNMDVNMYSLTNILDIVNILLEQKLVTLDTVQKIRAQISSK